jgi:hypothetical protein
MSWSSKILPFRKLARAAVVVEEVSTGDEFPRFHKERVRGPLTARPVVAGFGIPPVAGK